MAFIFEKPGAHHIKITKSIAETGYDFDVEDLKVVELVITKPPKKLSYAIGDELDLTGMEVVCTYNCGDVEIADDYIVSGYDNTKVNPELVLTLRKDEGVATLTIEMLYALYTYEIHEEDNYSVLNMYHGHDKELEIPDNFEGYPLKEIEATAFNSNLAIEHVVIPYTVETIH
jgi:hypothetical protein